MATHPVNIKDKRIARRQQRNPLQINLEAIEAALGVVGVELGAETEILIRIADGDGNNQGYARRIGADKFLVKLYVASKPVYADRHHYVVNNSLVHELRHVAQMQADPNQSEAYMKANQTVGYQNNPYEVDARAYGRLAWHGDPAEKLTIAGAPLGKVLWGLTFGKES